MAKTLVKINYTPRRWALNYLHATTKRFIVIVIHRRGGKTTAALQHLNRDALRNKNNRYAYIAPLRNQAKRIAWKMLLDITASIPQMRYNETELTAYYPNGSEVMLVGADNPDALRGLGLNGAILDEYPQMSPIVFTEIITKCVADQLGYIIILGTPKGKGHFFRVSQVASKSEDWLAIFKTIDDSLKEERGETIDNLRIALEDDRKLVKSGLMSQAEFDQEWYLSWEAALKGAVYGEQLATARKEKRITHVPYDESLPVFTVWDLGIGDAMSIGFFQKPSGRETHLIDYYENTGLGLSHYAAETKKRPYVYGKHFFPFDIKNRELATGKTRLDAVEKLFGKDKVEVIPRLSEEDGIDLARAMWRRLWVDAKKCELFEDLIGSHIYEFDDKRGIFRPKTIHDFTSHCAAMLRYAATIEDEFINEKPKKERTTHRAPAVNDDFVGELEPEWEDESGLPSKDELSKM